MKAVFFSGIIEGVSTRKDKTNLVRMATQELTPDKMAHLFASNQQFVYLAIKAEDFSKDEKELIEGLKAEPTGKTLSQQQRNVLYRIWEHNNRGFKEFSDYYAHRMQLNLEKLKTELDDITIGL